ncbi:MAG: signal peptidase II [Burkholderiales bacterium]
MLQIIIIVLAVAADQLTKFLLVPMLLQLPDKTMTVIPGVFKLTYVENEGASFGIFQGAQVFFIIVTVIVLIVGAVLMIKTRHRQGLFLKISLSLVIGGAIGNFIDRVFIGHVRDLFSFKDLYFPWVFNIADMCLVIGAIMLGVFVLFIYRPKEDKYKKDEDGKDDEKTALDEKE